MVTQIEIKLEKVIALLKKESKEFNLNISRVKTLFPASERGNLFHPDSIEFWVLIPEKEHYFDLDPNVVKRIFHLIQSIACENIHKINSILNFGLGENAKKFSFSVRANAIFVKLKLYSSVRIE